MKNSLVETYVNEIQTSLMKKTSYIFIKAVEGGTLILKHVIY